MGLCQVVYLRHVKKGKILKLFEICVLKVFFNTFNILSGVCVRNWRRAIGLSAFVFFLPLTVYAQEACDLDKSYRSFSGGVAPSTGTMSAQVVRYDGNSTLTLQWNQLSGNTASDRPIWYDYTKRLQTIGGGGSASFTITATGDPIPASQEFMIKDLLKGYEYYDIEGVTPAGTTVEPVYSSLLYGAAVDADGVVYDSDGGTQADAQFSFSVPVSQVLFTPSNSGGSYVIIDLLKCNISSISLEKTGSLDVGDDGVANVGDVITYSFTVTNTGTVTLTNVNLSDDYATVSGGPIATLEVGASDSTTFTATYALTQEDLDAGEFENTATVSAFDPDGETVTDVSDDPTNATDTDPDADGNPDDPTVVDLGSAPSISLEKTGSLDVGDDGVANVGDVITYSFTVTNTGNVTLTNVTLSDDYATVSGGPIATLEVGASDSTTFTATYALTQEDLDAGEFENTATVSAFDPDGETVTDVSDDPTNATDTDPDADGNPDDPTVVDLGSAPSISLEKTGSLDVGDDGVANVGDVITYSFTVTNTGNVTLTNVTLSDDYATVSGGPIATLEVGASDSTTFTATYALTQEDLDAGEFENTATVSAFDPDGETVTDVSDDPTNATDTDPDADGNPDDPTVVDLGSAPSISLEKTGSLDVGDDGVANVGDVITYSFTVTNTGNVTLTNVTLSDDYATVSGGPIATLEVGASDSTTFTATYALTQEDLDAGEFENTATVSAFDPDGETVTDVSDDPTNATDTDPDADGNPDDPTVVDLGSAPSISLEKTGSLDVGDDGVANVGDVITYSFTVTNTGNVTLTNVTLSDDYATVSGGPIATLEVGASDSTTFTATYALTQEDLDAGEFENTATVSAFDPDGETVTDVSDDPTNATDTDPDADGNPDDPTVVDLGSAPSISLEKTGSLDVGDDGVANVGDVITYSFTVTNTGNVTLTNVTLSDDYATVSGGPIATLEVGASDSTTFTATYALTQEDLDAGEFENTATVSAFDPDGETVTDVSDDPTNATDTDPDADGNPDDPTVVDLGSAPSISLEKTGSLDVGDDGVANVGDVITYSFTVTNTGNVTLTNVTLSDDYATVSGGPIATLEVGASDSTTFTATYALTQKDLDAGEFENTATVSAFDPDGETVTDVSDDPTNATDTDPDADGNPDDPTVVDLGSAPSISLEKTGSLDVGDDGVANVGDVITYSFTVTNTGNVTLTNVTLSDDYATVSGGPIATLEVGASDSTTFTATYALTQEDLDAGEFENTATVSAFDPDGETVTDVSDDPTNATDTDPDADGNPDDPTVVDLGSAPSISLEKTGSLDVGDDGVANVGDVITYSFTVTNTGNVTLTNVTLSDDYATVSGGPIATLEVGASDSTTFTATYALTQEDLDAGEFENTATVSAFDPDGETVTDVSDDPTNATDTDPDADGNPDDPTVVDLGSAPSISLEKTGSLDVGDDGVANVGDVITYSFTVTNTGNVTLTNVTLSDDYATVSGGPIATLEVGASDSTTFTATYALTQEDLDAGEFENTATVSAFDPDGETVTDVSDDPTNATDTDLNGDGDPDDPTVVVLPSATGDLFLTKTTSKTVVLRGGTVPYTISITNNNTQSVDGVNLVDVLPSDFVYVDGSATWNDEAVDVDVQGKVVTWSNVSVPGLATVEATISARVLTSADVGDHINTARAYDAGTGAALTNKATATVTIYPEPVFDCGDVYGKVFNDLNRDGYQNGPISRIIDEDAIFSGKYSGKADAPVEIEREIVENGIPAVRLTGVDGTVITTDQYGRFHVPCAMLPEDRGSNFILKLDTRSLPTGYRLTTENPRVVRLTPGKMTELNFGAALTRVVRVDLNAQGFVQSGAGLKMKAELSQALSALVDQIAGEPVHLRLAYHLGDEAGTAEKRLARQSMRQVERELRNLWKGQGRVKLTIEKTIVRVE